MPTFCKPSCRVLAFKKRQAFYMNWKTLKGVPKNYNAAQPNILAVTTLVYALRPEIPPAAIGVEGKCHGSITYA